MRHAPWSEYSYFKISWNKACPLIAIFFLVDFGESEFSSNAIALQKKKVFLHRTPKQHPRPPIESRFLIENWYWVPQRFRGYLPFTLVNPGNSLRYNSPLSAHQSLPSSQTLQVSSMKGAAKRSLFSLLCLRDMRERSPVYSLLTPPNQSRTTPPNQSRTTPEKQCVMLTHTCTRRPLSSFFIFAEIWSKSLGFGCGERERAHSLVQRERMTYKCCTRKKEKKRYKNV